ncbi:YigZ family protein [Parashewanella curva]|uniref:YigZ family protein n=1 Tax=Parashewanella curva TaxID=2338552 RepID=A0A3L8Q067_9GAMM|nr:YigZ family protein [Parashewanella curva]RLV60810.1 YigZ family protein [Parashewanella curva]
MASDRYLVPAQPLVLEEEIKKSRFITILFRCQSESELKLALTNFRRDYPDARHYCWAFVGGAPKEMVNCGSSDDGEPSGSAGRPMLSVLQGADIGEIGAIVVRYFGGTKLGVGGLVRAYSAGIKRGLPQLQTDVQQLRDEARLSCDYAQLSDVEYLCKKHQVLIQDQQFTEQVLLPLAIPKSNRQIIQQELATLSQGQLSLKFVE